MLKRYGFRAVPFFYGVFRRKMVGEGCGRKNAAGSRANPRSSRAGTMRETCRISARRVRFFSPKAARFSSSCDISGRSDFRIQVQDRGRILFCGAGSPCRDCSGGLPGRGGENLRFFAGALQDRAAAAWSAAGGISLPPRRGVKGSVFPLRQLRKAEYFRVWVISTEKGRPHGKSCFP